MKHYTVGDVARLAGVTVRTLHHYHARGLLAPSGRSQGGYRLYTDADVATLQQILFLRELGFGLERIRALLDPRADRLQALVLQRDMLRERAGRFQRMAEAVDLEIRGVEMAAEERYFPNQHEEEARERWGHTDAWRESTRRAKGYTKEDWERFQALTERVEAGLAALLEAGESPEGEEARALAEEHRLLIDRWFYPCPPEMHMSLGDMYVQDARFTEHYDKRTPGLAAFVREAIRANMESQGLP